MGFPCRQGSYEGVFHPGGEDEVAPTVSGELSVQDVEWQEQEVLGLVVEVVERERQEQVDLPQEDVEAVVQRPPVLGRVPPTSSNDSSRTRDHLNPSWSPKGIFIWNYVSKLQFTSGHSVLLQNHSLSVVYVTNRVF